MNFEDSDGEEETTYAAGYKFQDDDSFGDNGGMTEKLEKVGGSLIILFAFSVLTIADALFLAEETADLNAIDPSVEEVDSGTAIGISVASIVLILMRCCHSCVQDDELAPIIQVLIAVVFLILWAVGVFLLTFLEGGTFEASTTSGFFSTWGCLLVSGTYLMNIGGKMAEGSGGGGCCCSFDVKKGVTGNLGISIILCITVIITTSLDTTASVSIGGMFMAIFILIILLSMICFSYEKYGDLDKFTFLVSVLISISLLMILLLTTGEPFAIRPNDNEPLVVSGNGYFAVIGLFLSLVVMFWKSHVYILEFNRDEGGNYGVPGRYFWLFMLAFSGLVLVVSGFTECDALGGCQENQFVFAAILLGFATMILTPLIIYVGKDNIDNGDDQIVSPGSGFDWFDNNFQRLEFIGALLLQISWAGAAAAFTFALESPFITASNGFFFSWLGFAFASNYFSAVYPKISLISLSCLDWDLPNGMDKRNNLGIGIALIGILIQFADVLSGVIQKIDVEGIETEDFAAFGLQLINLIIIIMLLCVSPERLGPCAVVVAFIFLFTAYSLVVVTTIILNAFNGAEGNGFFAAWMIMFGAFYNINNYDFKMNKA